MGAIRHRTGLARTSVGHHGIDDRNALNTGRFRLRLCVLNLCKAWGKGVELI